MRLPEKFIEKMENLLGAEEYNEFISSFEDPRYYGLRVNTLKISVQDFLGISPFELKPIPWSPEGFYYPEGDRPGKHPYYHAGLYYIQEPSAMAPVTYLDPQPGERVLDLCAAPGGKSTQIAARLQGEGLLVSNDINSERVKPLIRNLEMFGIRNMLVTNETPERLVKVFASFFDKILIDAPCSGEGMFRKDPDAARQWGIHSVEKCVVMQRDILDQVAIMLRPGGRILYSTCTFSPEENEIQISNFLDKHPDFELIEIEGIGGISPGRMDWTTSSWEVEKTARLWPHKLEGEGHFMALLQKRQGTEEESFAQSKKTSEKGQDERIIAKQIEPFLSFCEDNLNITPEGKFTLFGEHLYLQDPNLPSLKGIKVGRGGWYLGELKKGRFEPSQALAMSLTKEDVRRHLELQLDSRELISYLKGETLSLDLPKGWTLVTLEGFPLGWAKAQAGIVKNLYPKGWRWLGAS